MSEGFEEAYKKVHECLSKSDNSVCDKPVGNLSYEDFTQLMSVLDKIATEYDFRPFWAICNQTFAAMANQVGAETWQQESPGNPAVRESMTAAILGCFLLANLQYNVLGKNEFYKIDNAIEQGGRLWQLQQPVKNAGISYRKLLGREPAGKKPSGCLILLIPFLGFAASIILWISV